MVVANRSIPHCITRFGTVKKINADTEFAFTLVACETCW
jgi:hypothetical protein